MSLFFHLFSFNVGHIGVKTSSVWVSLPIFVSSSWIFSSLDDVASLISSIINIQVIVYLKVFKIYMVAHFSSSLCKYRRIRFIFAFLTSLEYSPVTCKASIRLSGSTSFVQYNACCCSDLCSINVWGTLCKNTLSLIFYKNHSKKSNKIWDT